MFMTVTKLKPSECIVLLPFNKHDAYQWKQSWKQSHMVNFGPVPYAEGIGLINCIFLLFFVSVHKMEV